MILTTAPRLLAPRCFIHRASPMEKRTIVPVHHRPDGTSPSLESARCLTRPMEKRTIVPVHHHPDGTSPSLLQRGDGRPSIVTNYPSLLPRLCLTRASR